MDIQRFILDHWKSLVLVAGIMMFLLGILPIVSREYYEKFHKSTWDDKFWPFSKQDGYIYDRYIRQINFILTGLTLIGIVIYKFINP